VLLWISAFSLFFSMTWRVLTGVGICVSKVSPLAHNFA